MKVKELIEELKKFDGDYWVGTRDYHDGETVDSIDRITTDWDEDHKEYLVVIEPCG